MTIAIDFDGTIVEHRYPEIGKEIPFATMTLTRLMMDGHKLILWTVREGELLQEALDWCSSRGVEFYAVNTNHPEIRYDAGEDACQPRKLTADIFIDDRNLGGLPDWGVIYEMISCGLTWADYFGRNHGVRKPRSLWDRILRK